MFQTDVVEKIKTYILCSITPTPPRKSCRLWDKMEEYYRAGQAIDDDMVHVYCMMDTKGYKLTLRIGNTYCFSTATMVARTRLEVMLYIHFLSCCGFVASCWLSWWLISDHCWCIIVLHHWLSIFMHKSASWLMSNITIINHHHVWYSFFMCLAHNDRHRFPAGVNKRVRELVSSTEIVIHKKQFEIGKVVEINWGVV